jgi:hypothetical protein
MREKVVPAILTFCLAGLGMLVAAPVRGVSSADYRPRVSPDVAELQAQEHSALARGDVAAARELEGQVQAILIRDQHAAPQPAPVVAVKPGRLGANLAPDQLIYSGGISALSSDYEMDGTMWAAFAGPDSVIRVYKSSDHGTTWTKVREYFVPPKHAVDKIELVVGQGDSGFVYVFEIMPSSDGDLSAVRFDKDGTHLNNWGVLVGADTITDFTACRDFRDDYWLYAVAYNGADTTDLPSGVILRSTDYGITWTVTDSSANKAGVRMAFGQASVCYMSAVPAPHRWQGVLQTGVSANWSSPGTWSFYDYQPDTFQVQDACIAPAFTTPAENALVWLAYTHNDSGTADWDVYAAYANDTLLNWNGPTVVANTDDAEGRVDLKDYTSPGNDYVNISYVDVDSLGNGNAWLGYSNAGEPNVWSGLGNPWVNQTGHVGRGPATFPRIVYSPGGPGSGGGLIFAGQSGNGYFNAPWFTGVAEEKPVRSAPTFSVTPSIARGPVRVSWNGSAQRLTVSDATGRIVRRLMDGVQPAGYHSVSWDGKDDHGRRLANGVYFCRLTASGYRATDKVVLQR